MDNVEQEYLTALKLAKTHYENFPVISLFLPKKLHKHVAIIYKFARIADDYADEELYKDSNRLELLEEYKSNFIAALNNNYQNIFWQTLVKTINKYNLTAGLFIDLLEAFKQDLTKKEYSDFQELLLYCKNSANPIGRLILQLHGINNDEAYKYSDLICTALQLTNFWQDISVDLKKDRVYLPIEDMNKYGYSLELLKKNIYDEKFKCLIKYEVEITKKMFYEGAKLLKYLPFRLKIQIKLTILGGLRILDKIAKNDYNVITNRPTIEKTDIIFILIKSLLWKKIK
jgi:squalene synthase HpnC